MVSRHGGLEYGDTDTPAGMKIYIASERAGITTTAGLVRQLYGRVIQLGRQYGRNRNEADLFEALRLLGTGNHALEDYFAHSNWSELALIELGERDVFPHVGRDTQINLRGARNRVFPIVTGTFGGVDFLHSVMGEFDDKATQSEIQELEGTLQGSQQGGNESVLQDLLDKVPDGVFGGKNEGQKASELKQNATAQQMQNAKISPREPEEWASYLSDVQKQIYPILEFHDEIMKGITETIEQFPILPELIEQIQDEVNKFVFSLLAPFVVPIIDQIKSELNTGSSEIINSSKDKQHVVFNDDRSTDPTHSMLSKDHFSNILNELAGKSAQQMLKWVIPQIVEAVDNDRVDVDRTLDRIINGVLFHPALRDQGDDGASDGRRLIFSVVERWWSEKDEREKDDYRQKLSRRGVESGQNHKPGEHDKGHGCGKPLGMPNVGTAQSSGAIGGVLGAALGGGGGQGGYGGRSDSGVEQKISKAASEAAGGGALGSIVGGIAGAVGGGLLGGAFKSGEEDKPKRENYGNQSSYGQGRSDYSSQSGYGRQDEYGSGGRAETSRYEQRQEYGGSSGGYGQERRENQSSYGGGAQSGGQYGESRREEYGSSGGYGASTGGYGQQR